MPFAPEDYASARPYDLLTAAARAHVARLKAELEADPAQAQRAREAARRRAAQQRQERLEQALARGANVLLEVVQQVARVD